MGLYIEPRWETFNLLAMDPGKRFVGLSVHELETRTGKYRNIFIETLNVERTFNPVGLSDDVVCLSDRALMKIRHNVMDLVDEYEIAFFAFEEPFYNPRRPFAYGSLKEVTACVRQSVLEANPNVYIESMSPQNIKKGMGAGGTKGKDIMFEKVLANEEMMKVLRAHPDDLTEHCIDSMAIGYNARNSILAPQEGWDL